MNEDRTQLLSIKESLKTHETSVRLTAAQKAVMNCNRKLKISLGTITSDCKFGISYLIQMLDSGKKMQCISLKINKSSDRLI